MSRKNGYRLTTANIKEARLTNEDYQAARLEIAATEILNQKIVKDNSKRRKKRRKANWPGKIDYHDYQHMQSISQELRSP